MNTSWFQWSLFIRYICSVLCLGKNENKTYKHATKRSLTIYLHNTAKFQLKVLELQDFSREDCWIIFIVYRFRSTRPLSFYMIDKRIRELTFSARKPQPRQLKLKCRKLDTLDKNSSYGMDNMKNINLFYLNTR